MNPFFVVAVRDANDVRRTIPFTELVVKARTPLGRIALLLTLLAALTGCSGSPEAQKARHLERGDTYFARGQYREAVIEYRNVLRFEPANVQAVRRLGLAHYHVGEIGSALGYLRKARELDPANLDVRQKLAIIYLLGGRPADARQEAAFVLDRDAKNLEALAVLGSAAVTPQQVTAVIGQLEAARGGFGGRAKWYLALGSLHLRAQNLVEAEKVFREAVAVEPTAVDAHLALGSFYEGRRDLAQAERELRVAADLAPAGSLSSLSLANFYLRTGRVSEGKRLLDELARKTPESLPVWLRVAEVALAEGRYDDTAKAVQVVLAKNPSDLNALLLRGRMRLAKGETAEAIQDLQQILTLEPGLASARYQLALAHLRAGNTQQARAELTQATSKDPNFTDASLLAAEVDIRMEALAPAIETLQRITASRPREVRAHVLLGLAYLSNREPVKATAAYRKLVELAPTDPRGPYLVGVALLAQGRRVEAQRQFEAALAKAPGYVEPLAQLVSLALAEKNPDAALERVKRQVALAPSSGELQLLLGETHRARGDLTRAETAYVKALDLQPGLVGAYVKLGELYTRRGQHDHALGKLEGALRVSPKSLPALMLSGVIYERKGDVARAQEAYQKVLEVNPRFAPAANNLAYLLMAHGGDKERALRLAQTAKDVAPDEPHVSDTLGWILYNRGVYQQAHALLKESAAKLPENPEVQYHLGMAALKTGDKESAKKSLAAAVAAPTNFLGKEEARRALAQLK